ncbi:methyl-accepting chemotaxis protein [Bacillota bacterium Lsc_1132]
MVNKIDSLESAYAMIPIIQEAVPIDIAIGICDLEKFIAYLPGERIDLNIKAGQLLNPEEPLYLALINDKPYRADVPAEFYGFEFTGTAIPLHDNTGKVIGGLAIQMRRQTELRQISDQILNSLTQAKQEIIHVAETANSLAGFSQELLAESTQAAESVQKTEGVLSLIKKIADQTNLLGINAAIEAAHAGEKGKGFGVVADEIRKLSNETLSSTVKIKETLKRIQEGTQQIGSSIQQIAAIGQEQAASTQQISTFIEEIQDMSYQLNQFANKL